MLQHLTVENYALIERLDMTLSSRLNIITGETGAGKSILMGALGLVLGERADVATLKESGKGCVVEATFNISEYHLEEFFESNDLEYDAETVIRRVITPAGKSRAYVNDLPVPLTTLRELSTRLIDIHSQHSSLMLSEEGFRMAIVDAMAANHALREEYTTHYRTLLATQRELSKAEAELEAALRDKEYVEYQYNQLSALHLRAGELEELEQEQRLLDNVERISEALGEGGVMLDEEEQGVLARLKRIESSFARIKDVYAPAEDIAERVRGALVELKDISALLAEGRERVDGNPQRAAEVVDRIDAIYTLMRKHSVQSVEELLEIEAQYRAKLNVIVDGDAELERLRSEVAAQRQMCAECAARLTQSRQEAALILAKQTEAMLARLGMEQSRFVCDVEPLADFAPSGADGVVFRFSSTPKFQPQPIEKVASGGEISRVMLCLKALVADKTQMPTLVFDEIDTGISGRVADVTGEIIAELSAGRQVINITHLPQVASKGNTHFRVFKSEGTTQIKHLSAEERVGEIAAMLSGSNITDAAIAQAKALIGKNS